MHPRFLISDRPSRQLIPKNNCRYGCIPISPGGLSFFYKETHMEIYAPREVTRTGKFWLNNELVDTYMGILGKYPVLVYLLLTRMSNRDQLCYPSITHIQKRLRMHRKNVIVGLNKLVQHNLIQRRGTKKPNGQTDNNRYVLMCSSVWCKEPMVPKRRLVVVTGNHQRKLREKDIYKDSFTGSLQPPPKDRLRVDLMATLRNFG